jgi:hypothetical protein
VEQYVANSAAEAGLAGAYLTLVMKTLQVEPATGRPAARSGRELSLAPLRAAPVIAIALAAVLVTIWLAADNLRPHSLFADPVAATALK